MLLFSKAFFSFLESNFWKATFAFLILNLINSWISSGFSYSRSWRLFPNLLFLFTTFLSITCQIHLMSFGIFKLLMCFHLRFALGFFISRLTFEFSLIRDFFLASKLFLFYLLSNYEYIFENGKKCVFYLFDQNCKTRNLDNACASCKEDYFWNFE